MPPEHEPDSDFEGDFGNETSGQEEERDPVAEPGEELFDKVVGESSTQRVQATAEAVPSDSMPLRDSVAGIYEMVKDLEVQLNHMISINEAAERELDGARKDHRATTRERDELKRTLAQRILDAQSSAELRDELHHIAGENERLAEELRDLDTNASRWKQEIDDLKTDLTRESSGQEELREEVECVESQLARTAEYIEALRAELEGSGAARQQQSRRLDLADQRLHVVTEERDALRLELNESRAALEEIRRSIMDTNMQSQRSFYES